jgi:hypothetical protein
VGHAERVELGIHLGLSIAPIGRDGPGHLGKTRGDAADSGGEHGCVRRVAHFDAMVEHDAVAVVGDLSLVAELDGATEVTRNSP